MGKGILRALLKDPLLKEKGNCSKQIPANNNNNDRTFVNREAGKQAEVSQMKEGN